MVRFAKGKPVAVYTSWHGGGDSWTYDTVEKREHGDDHASRHGKSGGGTHGRTS